MFKKRNNTIKRGKYLNDLILVNSKLKFSSQQLHNLNYIFNNSLEEKCSDKHTTLATSVTERLIQRLVCSAGRLDERFASKFLVLLRNENEASTNLKYLIRLDSLSSPKLYVNDDLPKFAVLEYDQDCPRSYARIRLFSNIYKTWGEYANNQGYLRRDKLQARFIELLASAAANENPSSPSEVDESKYCGSPGKVVTASTLHNILKIPSENHAFYGCPGTSPRFPDPRDFRLAIVDEPEGIRVRVEFLSPALNSICINVRLIVAIGFDAWAASTDFPSRIPLGHPDALLYQQAAQTGMYLVGYGVQSSAWQIRFPAAEEVMLDNYGDNSAVRRIYKTLGLAMDEIYRANTRHQRHELAYKTLNSYIFKTILFQELERDFNNPTTILLNWATQSISTQLLKILDRLICSLRRQKQPNYFFPEANLLANPGHLTEDDYIYEAKRVLTYLVKLSDVSSISTVGNCEFENMLIAEDMEMMLLLKWKQLIGGLLPPISTRGRRFCFIGSKLRKNVAYTQYTGRQLEYIALLLKNALNVRKNILQPIDETWQDNNPSSSSTAEDIIYILLLIIDQAKVHYLKNNDSLKVRTKLANHYDSTILKLTELVRKTNDSAADDADFVKTVLKWLYGALDQSKRFLAPILRPYLNILFISSHGCSWFMDAIKKRNERTEIQALGTFACLVNEDKITPAEGLVDCVNKRWVWAKDMLDLIERQHLRLVFVPGSGHTGRHVMSVPQGERKPTKMKTSVEQSTFYTLSKNNYFYTILNGVPNNINFKVPWHYILRDSSPMTKIFRATHNHGQHRCGGDLIKTLISMQKLNVLQDVSSILPQEDQLQLLDLVHKYSNEKRKNTVRRRAETLPNLSKSAYCLDSYQKYTPKDESAGVKLKKDTRSEMKLNKLDINSELLDSCRATRIKEDYQSTVPCDSYGTMRLRRLVRSKESFRI